MGVTRFIKVYSVFLLQLLMTAVNSRYNPMRIITILHNGIIGINDAPANPVYISFIGTYGEFSIR